jgi:hypothetical protein
MTAMTPPAATTPGGQAPRLAVPLVGAVLFAVAYTQPPLYYSNQNQYFLHGLARAGYGDLGRDWLARTADPTPAFTAFVELAYRSLGEWPFHAAFFALLVVYFLSLWGVVAALPFRPATTAGRAALAAALIVVHSAIVRVASVQLVGVDDPWYLQAGVANQYLLGAGLQPSAFGVLLLTSLAAFARGRPATAGVLAAAACALHSTYLLPAGLLVGGMVLGLAWAGRPRAAITAGAVALVGVAPVVAYTLAVFAPTDPARFAEAQAVLAWLRIPHHTEISQWLDWVAALQVAWLAAGIAAYRRTPLFVPLAAAAAGGLALTLVQAATGDATLALLFPWRISAVLVPVATGAAAAGLAKLAESTIPPRPLLAVSGLLVAAAVGGAAVVYAEKLGYQETAAEAELLRRVAATRRPGELYLLPADFPDPPKTRGSKSLTFVPVPKTDRPAIFELQRFRLGTGAAAYVDFKSVPYRDDEVLEWRRRVATAARWYRLADWDASGAATEAAAEGVTHVVVPAGTVVRSRRLELADDGPAYRVYRLRPGD